MKLRSDVLGVIVAICLFAAALPVGAATLHVPADYPTIQLGIAAALPGDVVEVACGTYYESFIVMKSGVTLRGETGDPACVTVDAQHLDRVFHCQGMNSDTRIEGITITHGLEDASGGLWCVSSTMTIENCVFVENEVNHDSGAIGLFQASPTIRDCTFLRNRTSGLAGFHNRGGAIYMQNNCSPVISGCTFVENEAWLGGAIWCNDTCTPTITDCTFLRNTGREGGAVSIEGNSVYTLQGCVFANNTATQYGGGLFLNGVQGITSGCTFHGNSAAIGGGQVWATGTTTAYVSRSIFVFGAGVGGLVCNAPAVLDLDCCDVFGNTGGDWVGCLAGQAGIDGDFSADPAFCDATAEDFTLYGFSPCLPGNHPDGVDCGLIGALGHGCGPVALAPETWARVKGRYR